MVSSRHIFPKGRISLFCLPLLWALSLASLFVRTHQHQRNILAAFIPSPLVTPVSGPLGHHSRRFSKRPLYSQQPTSVSKMEFDEVDEEEVRKELRMKLVDVFGNMVQDSIDQNPDVSREIEMLANGEARVIGTEPEPVNSNIARISEDIPNAWLAVCHSKDLGPSGIKKVLVEDTPICLFRISTGEVRAISDICLHRAAALSDGYMDGDTVVCPYHGYKFDGDGKLRYIPGVDENLLAKNKKTARTVWYKTLEQGGLIYIFPDAMRAGAIEQYVKPFLIPEATDPSFRCVEGQTEIGAAANLVVENLLDMLHISYVHSFGNMQDPLPYQETYDLMYDDPSSQLMPYARTTFKYRAGSRSISKVVGGVQEVLVENEFHLPFTTVTRVKFGKDTKTVYVVAVPISKNRTVVHYKLYRNFMYTHPKDEGPINRLQDLFIQSVMKLTLNEDKAILESLYTEHQQGYVLSRYDRALKLYRKNIKDFIDTTKGRMEAAERQTLEMELLRLIETTERGRKATKGQHITILKIISDLEGRFLKELKKGRPDDLAIDDSAVNGSWHLVYANPGNVTSSGLSKSKREEEDELMLPAFEEHRIQSRLKSAGTERYLLDFKAKGRPIWADIEQSMQLVDTRKSLLSNIAIFQGLLGIRTKVELAGGFSKTTGTRKDVKFKTAEVDIGGLKLVFPHMDWFGISGWIDTTFVDKHIKICRGNRGSVFVLTRRPLGGGVSSEVAPDQIA